MKKSLIFLIIVTFVISSCSQRIFDFTLVSTKNVDLSKAGTFKRINKKVTGEDGVYYLISIPLGFPNLKQAIDKAIESTPGTVALVDGVVFSKSWWVVITGYTCYYVEGTPLIDPSLALNTDNIGKYNICLYDKNGKMKDHKVVTKAEFDIEKNKQIKHYKVTDRNNVIN